MNPRALCVLLFLCIAQPLHAATELIPLNHRLAEELLPVAESILEGEGKASAYGNRLIVNASPEKLRELREVLDQLDTPARRLLISVSSRDGSARDTLGYRLDANGSIGGVQVQVGDGAQGQNRLRVISRSTQSRDDGLQQIHASEGYPALIQTGQSVPITTLGSDGYGEPYPNTQYRDLTRGLYVTARLSGDTVHLTLSSQHERMGQTHAGVIDSRNAETRISGRLGEWIPVGGSGEQLLQRDVNLLRHSTQDQGDLSLHVKVEALD